MRSRYAPFEKFAKDGALSVCAADRGADECGTRLESRAGRVREIPPLRKERTRMGQPLVLLGSED